MAGSSKEHYETLMNNTIHAKITAWWVRAMDIIPVSGGKGSGIRKILDCNGLDKSQAIAF